MASPLWSEDFTAKLSCNVEFWPERLPKLMEYLPEFERLFAVGRSLVPQPRSAVAEPTHPEFHELITTFPPAYPF